MSQLYWDSIELGDPVAPLTKPAVTRVQIAKFAAAAHDWSPLHIDDDFAKSAGYGSVFAHGAISLGFAVEAVGRWLENGRVVASIGTFQKLVWPGDILTAKGVVVKRYELNGEARVDVDVWAENQNHDIVMKGQITCLLWRNDKDEKKSKSPWPSVSADTIKERRTAKPIPRNEAELVKAREAAAAQQQPAGHSSDRRSKSPAPPPRPAAPPPRPMAPPPPRAAPPAPAKSSPPPPPPKAAAPAKAPPPPKAAAAAKAPPQAKAPSPKPVASKAPAPAKAPSKPAKAAAKPAKAAPKKPAPKPAAKKPAPKKPAPKGKKK